MMQQLRCIPATELKMDTSFVQNLQKSGGSRILVQET
jgi:predicted signal transduction protein with EAL and GGDEF domain